MTELSIIANKWTGFYMIGTFIIIELNEGRNEKINTFKPTFQYYTPWKRQKTFSFLTSSGAEKWSIRQEWVEVTLYLQCYDTSKTF